MYMTTWTLLIQFLMVLIIQCCTGSTDVKCDDDALGVYSPQSAPTSPTIARFEARNYLGEKFMHMISMLAEIYFPISKAEYDES